MMKDTPSSAVLAVEHADAPNQKNEVFWGISTFSIPFFAGNLSYALLFLENSHIATPEFSFSGGMEQKRAKIFQLKFHGSFPPSCGRDPLL